MRGRKKTLTYGQPTAVDEIAWQRDTKTQHDELPDLVCSLCMRNWVAFLVGRARRNPSA